MNYTDYPYRVWDLRSTELKSEPVKGYFRTRKAAEENATLRNNQTADAYGMKRYIVIDDSFDQ